MTYGSAEATSTGWSAAILYNAIVYVVLIITTFLMLCCIIIPQINANIVTATNCYALCLIPATLAGAILSIVRVTTSLGAECLEYEGVSWVDEGGMIGGSYLDFDLGAEISYN